MYLKSLVVFALCTLFVLGFVVVLNYVASGVGSTAQGTSSATSCQAPSSTAAGFSITSAALRTVNYTDELGIVNYAFLAFNVNASAGSSLASLLVCVDGSRAGLIQGPFMPGVSRLVNLTLPATISISPGKMYTVNVEGYYGGGSTAWESVAVRAR
jgi:hypothetical protein